MTARLLQDAVDPSFRVDVGKLGNRANKELTSIVFAKIGDRTTCNAHQAIGPMGPKPMQRVSGEKEKANVLKSIASGAKKVEKVGGAPSIADPIFNPLEFVDDY